MGIRTSLESLQKLIHALQGDEPRATIASKAATRLMQKIATSGWAIKYEIEDLMVEMDSRLDPYEAGSLDFLTTLFGLRWQEVAFRPRVIAKEVMLYNALPSAELASLLIQLESLGFRIDPEPLVMAILPRIKRAAVLSDPELKVFWFRRSRHRNPPLTLRIDDASIPVLRLNSWRTGAGYRIELWGSQNGELCQMKVHAPRFRRQPPLMRVTCPGCNYTYFRGDPESSADHRREHKHRMTYLDPQPHAQLLLARQSETEPELVTTASPTWKHKEMYVRAHAFKREFGYDFVQWESARGDRDPDAHGVLLSDDAGAIVGACAFRWRQDKWGLQWIWICPKQRRQGWLTRRWACLRERFGDFQVEAPVSEAMQAFLKKRGDSMLAESS